MNKGNKRFLAYAVALATSFSALPGMAYAEAAATDKSAVQTAQEAAVPQGTPAQTAAQGNAEAQGKNVDPRTEEW
ncbi:MAG: hypothetical protein II089_07080, partial [Selenomonas sp.]|nr:hypothetical protein [Selenomonas sp.]